MNGAQALFNALTSAGLDTCFANPGTSEMQLVYEMGKSDAVRPILCLQENVVTGAADGYARMAEKPAFTLLHVGSGFANGIANLHNAGRANTPIVNIVGANATYHQPNFPEHEFIGGKITEVARAVSHWTREAKSSSEMGLLGAEAVREAMTGCGKISTLIAPTDCHWDPAPDAPVDVTPIATPCVAPDTVEATVKLLSNGRKTGLLLGNHALRNDGLEIAGRIAARTGVQLLGETFPARLARGEGCVPVQLVPYFLEMAQGFFAEYEQIILVGAMPPVSTFAYQHSATSKVPPSCDISVFASPDHDVLAGLRDLEAALGASGEEVSRSPRIEPELPAGTLTAASIGQSVSLLMPEGSALVDEGATAGLDLYMHTAGARQHEYLYAIPGAAIGNGLPVALGAAIAAPERKVVALQADGSGMYTNQALWSIAREECDVTIVILKNDAYAVLNIELARVREDEPTAKMLSMLELDRPSIDWVKISEGMGVPAVAVETAEDFHREFEQAMAVKGPRLIEATIAQNLQPVVDLILAQQRGA
ncbi:acetolactate synthase large subunit [Pseudohalioglobus lutimaris]|uniref:Acetolactate synthase large subunit n=1 Tax=Pseudohalioglobus lutimaris TaxID=1737061 RepID=A0A2N5X069_9GAMM|nr:acetolactate synthase large subunit [Pseudohalioglobus lutimaris]PLW67881.1 acetolactate synthase large subunit [Pseudohalioglobus lutimaris]